MALVGCRICCTGPLGLRQTVEHMASELGATYAIHLDYSCTHLLATEITADVYYARKYLPWVRVVHQRWIGRCQLLGQRERECGYDLSYYLAARRTGTSTRRGCCNVFFREVGLFHRVEGRLWSQHGKCQVLRHVLANCDVRKHRIWRYARDLLLDTTFWGHLIRQRNWEARRTVMMTLDQIGEGPPPRKRMRVASDGPAHTLLALRAMPKEIWRAVVEFI